MYNIAGMLLCIHIGWTHIIVLLYFVTYSGVPRSYSGACFHVFKIAYFDEVFI